MVEVLAPRLNLLVVLQEGLEGVGNGTVRLRRQGVNVVRLPIGIGEGGSMCGKLSSGSAWLMSPTCGSMAAMAVYGS